MKKSALSLMVGGVLLAGFAGQASATSSDPWRGCPPSYTVWPVSTQPYQADNHVDQMGNNDGTVCAKQIDDKTFELNGTTYPLYNFIDNTVATPQGV